MQEPRSPRPFPVGLLAGFTLLLLTTGSAIAWWTWHSASTPPTPATAINPQPSVSTATNPQTQAPAAKIGPSTASPSTTSKSATTAPEQSAPGLPRTYWVKNTGSKVALVPDPLATARANLRLRKPKWR